MKTNIQRIIINHMNAGNIELHGICVNELVKDIESEIKTAQCHSIYEKVKEAWTTETDGEPEPWEVLTDKGIYFDDES